MESWIRLHRIGRAAVIIDWQDGTFGMHDEEAIALHDRIVAEGMAKVADGAALDGFLSTRGVDAATVLRDVWCARFANTSLRSHVAAVEAMLRLHAPPDWLHENGEKPATLARWLALVQRDLEPTEGLSAYLADRAKALGTLHVRRSLSEPAQLLDALDDARLRLDANGVQTDCLYPVPLEDMLACLQEDGIALYAFRASLSSASEDLDRAIDTDWSRFSGGVAAGLLKLFDRSPTSLTPLDYLAAFPRAAVEPDLLSGVLDEFARRAACTNALIGDDAVEWPSALANFRCWARADLRRLSCMDDLLAARPDPYLATLSAAVRDGWQRDRPMAAFGALTLIRGARCVSAVNRKLEDRAREEHCRSSLAALEDGEGLLRLADLCLDLPLGLRGERHVWSGLTDPIKAHWIRRAASAVEGFPALGDGLIAFVLAWSSRETYADLEPLILTLQATHDRRELLRELAALPGNLAAARASYLLDEFDVHPPASLRGRGT